MMKIDHLKLVNHAVLILAAIMVISSGCQDNLVIPAQPEFTGTYTGMYICTRDTMSTLPSLQPIIWIFGARYTMQLDTSKGLEKNRAFCDIQGTYEITDAVILHQEKSNLGRDICDSTQNPTGRFVVLKHTPDSLVMVQITGFAEKRLELRLIRP